MKEKGASTRKIVEGETAFGWVYMQNFRFVCCSRREENKDGERQKQKCTLGPSALLIGVYNYLSAELSQQSARGNTKQNGRPLLP